ncbi:MAG TPA: type II CAAX endopeptidase family protein [Terriglobales bacterium]
MARSASPSRTQIVTYLITVFLLSSFFYFLILRSGSMGYGQGMYVFGLMWCPALAAFITLRLNGRSLNDLGWSWGDPKYQVASWFIPLLYTAIAYSIVWIAGLGHFGNPEYIASLAQRMHLPVPTWVSAGLAILLIASFGLLRSLTSALGEEIGWRGFFVPELYRNMSYTKTALFSGVVWSLWHYPILIFGDYNSGTKTWYALTCFTVLVISISFVFAWMRLKSGSLWTGAILHASHNLYVQSIFTPITKDAGKTAWYIDEFGAVLPLVAVAFAIYFWRRRGELPAATNP